MGGFVLTMKHMALNTIAKIFWTTPNVKELIKAAFVDICVPSYDEGWFAIKKKFYPEVYHHLESWGLPLPSAVQRQLRTCVGVCGDSLFKTLSDLLKMISAIGDNGTGHMEKFIDNMCLTHDGSIDVSMTFRRTYSAKPQVVDYYMFILACELCLEDYVLQWRPRSKRKNKAVTIVRLIFEETPVNAYRDVYGHELLQTVRTSFNHRVYYHFLMYWKLWISQSLTATEWSLFLPSDYGETFDVYSVWDHRNSIAENMFRESAAIGNFYAMKYFWKKMTMEEKSKDTKKIILLACANLCLESPLPASPTMAMSHLVCREFLPTRLQYFETIYFLIGNTTQSQASELFIFPSKEGAPMDACLKEYLCPALLKYYLRYPEFCVNHVQLIFVGMGHNEDAFTHYSIKMIMYLVEFLYNNSELHGEVILDILYEFLRLSPVDSASQMKNFIDIMWDVKHWNFYSEVLQIIGDPSLPKFVENYTLVKHWHEMMKQSAIDLEMWRVNRRFFQYIKWNQNINARYSYNDELLTRGEVYSRGGPPRGGMMRGRGGDPGPMRGSPPGMRGRGGPPRGRGGHFPPGGPPEQGLTGGPGGPPPPPGMGGPMRGGARGGPRGFSGRGRGDFSRTDTRGGGFRGRGAGNDRGGRGTGYGGFSRGAPRGMGRGGAPSFGDRGGRGGGTDRGGRGGPMKRGRPPGVGGPPKRPRYEAPPQQAANGYATQPTNQGYGGPGNGYSQPQQAPVAGYGAPGGGNTGYGPPQGGYQQPAYQGYESYQQPSDYTATTGYAAQAPVDNRYVQAAAAGGFNSDPYGNYGKAPPQVNYQQEAVAPAMGGGDDGDGGYPPGNPYEDPSCNPRVMAGQTGGYSTHGYDYSAQDGGYGKQDYGKYQTVESQYY